MYRHLSLHRDGKKRWALGCAILHPGFRWMRGEFTQPRVHCTYVEIVRLSPLILPQANFELVAKLTLA